MAESNITTPRGVASFPKPETVATLRQFLGELSLRRDIPHQCRVRAARYKALPVIQAGRRHDLLDAVDYIDSSREILGASTWEAAREIGAAPSYVDTLRIVLAYWCVRAGIAIVGGGHHG